MTDTMSADQLAALYHPNGAQIALCRWPLRAGHPSGARQPEEIADNGCVSRASDSSSYISDRKLVVDGADDRVMVSSALRTRVMDGTGCIELRSILVSARSARSVSLQCKRVFYGRDFSKPGEDLTDVTVIVSHATTMLPP